MSNPNRENPRRKLVLTSALIDHPVEGLILFETGPGEAYPEVWGPPINDIFGRVDYSPEHELEAALAKSGHSIKDIKAVVMGHLHIDHAGGLEKFSGTDVPIYVHEEELKHAFYSVATKSDAGALTIFCLQSLAPVLNSQLLTAMPFGRRLSWQRS